MTPALSGRAGRGRGFDTLALTDGTVLALRDLGPRDAATTIVLHHGWTQDHTSWEDVAALLAEDFRVISYDARGHGRSDAGPRGSTSMAQMADDLAEVIARLAPAGDIVLAGHSLGGPVLLAFVEQHPELMDRVVGLALVATAASAIGSDILGLPGLVTNPLIRVLPSVLTAPGRLPLRRTALGPVMTQVIRLGLFGPGAATAERRRRTAAQVARSHPATIVTLAAEIIRQDRTHVLDALAGVPVTVLAGTHDALTPVAHSRAIAAALPTAELVVYRGAGHMLPYERTAEVVEQLAALATPESRSATS